MMQLLPLAFLTSVSAHGGVLWPPTWQAGVATPIEELNSEEVFSDPLVHDPKTGQAVKDIKSWLTDQAYTGGVGDEFRFVGPVTNHEEKCGVRCVDERNPWAAPGQAPSLGGGCGVFGGNPWGCPKVCSKEKKSVETLIAPRRTWMAGLLAQPVVRRSQLVEAAEERHLSAPMLGSLTSLR